jgi:hypothetical protein
MAIALRHDNPDPDSVHTQTYRLARQYLPREKFESLIDSSNTFRMQTYRSRTIFRAQLPSYSIKPLYIHLVRFAHMGGVPLPQATVVPSLISFVLICLLMYFWVHKCIPEPFAFAICAVVIALPFLLEGSGLSTPDLLCAAFLLMGSYALLERKSLPVALVLFTAAIFTRIDSILFALILTGYSVLRNNKQWLMAVSWAILMTLGTMILFSNTGIGLSEILLIRSAPERTAGIAATPWLSAYSRGALHGLRALMHTSISFFVMVAFVGLYVKSGSREGLWHNAESTLLLAILFHMLLRFILHPIIEDRFVVADYLLILIVFLMTIRSVFNVRREVTG